MPSKKIVFVIVEGPSDDETLGLLLSRIYNAWRYNNKWADDGELKRAAYSALCAFGLL